MSVHQIITGALNKGESVFSVGVIEGISFTACAVGCDIVILDGEFQRVQIIPGSSTGFVQVTAIACCQESGKIAAAYYDFIRIYKPFRVSDSDVRRPENGLNYQWFETFSFPFNSFVTCLSWNLDGLRLLVSSENELQMLQHPIVNDPCNLSDSNVNFGGIKFGLETDLDSVAVVTKPWKCIWCSKINSPLRQVKFSPDSALFATCGKDDRVIRVWFLDSTETKSDNGEKLVYNYVCLQHPKPVVGFEWRKSGRYMLRGFVANVLISWCQDHISRIWCETTSIADADLGQPLKAAETTSPNQLDDRQDGRDVRWKILQRFKHLKKKKKAKLDSSLVNNSAHPLGFSNEFFCTSTDELGAGVHFHLSASINPKTGKQDSTMTVHWLNNKELVFCRGAEKVLAEAVHFENLTTGRLSLTVDQKILHSESKGSDLDQSSTASRKDYVDVKLDLLFREWQHSFDVLFAIHPLDGSLLVWTVDYLDNVTRQAQVNFASRLPGVFPLTDAASLHHNLAVLNSPGSSPLIASASISKSSSSSSTAAAAAAASFSGNCKFTSDFLVDQEQHLSVYLLTTHHNGTLNLWHLNLDEKSNYSHILSITHKSRMCGHRFIVKSVACHPILPLFLTTSHHNVRRKKFVEEQNSKKHPITNSDVQLFNSELILWYVEPVGPLKKSGGVFELSRINSSELSAFSSIAWIPSVLPSSTLGQACNSVSCCFIASDGQCLRIYQAVLDARALLSDMKFAKQPSMRNNLCENLNARRRFSTDLPMLNIVSTQSTARPGCIIELDMIADASHEWRHVQLMHVFHEEIMLANNDSSPSQSELLDRSDATAFHDRFYLVLLERRKVPQGSTTFIIHMWLIGLYVHSDEATLDDIEGHGFVQHGDVSSKLHIYSKKVCSQVLPLPEGVKVVDCSPSVGHLSSASLYPSCRAPYLLVTACSDRKFRFWKCNVDKNYSNNNHNHNHNTPVAMSKSLRYTWLEWKMANGKGGPSEIETEGAALRVSCAYSGRIACAYDPEIPMVGAADANVETVNVNVAVYECESTGGIEWIEENLIQLKNIRIQRIAYVPSDADAFSLWWEQSPDWQPNLLEKRQNSMMLRITSTANISTLTKNTVKGCYVEGGSNEFRCRDMVRLAWVSAEDGSHILTIGVGSSIFLYAPVAEDIAQHYVAMMKEPEQGNQKRRGLFRRASTIATRAKHMVRWICLRRVELESADGLPPMPRMLSWVRHGIMVVGLDTEMRIYSQWNMTGTCVSDGLVTSKSTAVFPTAMSALDLMRKTDSGSKKRRDVREAHSSKEKVAEQWSERFLRLVSFEGLFEAARVATPLLPQYHPRQLIELMKAGQTGMVQAILLHVLNQIRKYDVPRARRCGPASSELNYDLDSDDTGKAVSRRPSLCAPEVGLLGDDGSAEYMELDFISPLPLYSLLQFNLNLFNVKNTNNITTTTTNNTNNNNNNSTQQLLADSTTTVRNDYDALLDDGLLKYKIECDPLDDDDLDATDNSNTGKEVASGVENSNTFGSEEAALLSSMLTHIHLPGLSSLDQLYLLAIADTISSIKPGFFEQLNFTPKFFNSAFNPRTVVVNQTNTTGLSTEAVDECGLRYLMSVRHFEYLLRCLPLPQRAALRANGLPSANLIWALHSESENELFNSLSCVQRNEANWPDLRSLGVGWWLKSLQSLRFCFEKIAKAAFQARNDPMDAALFYLAMKKKNVLMHLFKTVRDVKMTEFLSHDFTDAKWKKAALKNAFVLMSKQRFEHAVGWFLLGDSLNDAVKVCLANMNDLQLALVIIRLYEGDSELARRLIRRVLCEQVLQCEEELFEKTNEQSRGTDWALSLLDSSGSDPFQRSIALWLMGEPALAASTLLSSSAEPCLRGDPLAADYSSSDVFNFYVYIRAHPLVLRRRLADQGIHFDHAGKFQQAARRMVSRVSASERMLFFKTAFVHLQGGCPLLALEVLCKLPDCDHEIDDDNDDANVEVKQQNNCDSNDTNTTNTAVSVNNNNNNNNNRENENQGLDQVWQFGDQTDYLLNRRDDDDDELKFDWNDENNSNLVEEEEEEGEQVVLETKQTSSTGEPATDLFAQTLKFIACMKMLTEELANLISGFELDIGQMRDQLYKWLENEVDVLKLVCDYKVNVNHCGSPPLPVVEVTFGQGSPSQLHEAIHHDRAELAERWQRTIKRHRWLVAHQQVLRTLAYFCSLHCSRSPGLAASRMELLLLIQELTQNLSRSKLTVRMPLFASFPLMSAALGSVKSAVALPLRYILSQTSDILITLSELQNPPAFQQPVQEIHLLYNLCQCLSSSVFCSLCDLGEIINSKDEFLTESNSYLQRNIFRRNSAYQQSPIQVTSKPSQWPGIDLSSSFLTTDRDEDVPNLLILLVETWTSIYLSLFAYCMYAYDSRWLYRLMAHPVNESLFATVFGGSGERQLLVDALNPTIQNSYCSSGSSDGGSYSKNDNEGTVEQLDSAKLRAKFHYKVFGKSASNPNQATTTSHRLVSSRLEWVQPKKSIIAYYTSKPPLLMEEEEQFGYDSDDSDQDSESESQDDTDECTINGSSSAEESKEHSNPNSYSWQIIRLALVRQAAHRVRQFLAVAGIDCSELGSTSPLVYSCLKMLNCWANILTSQLNNFPGGCPDHFLPSSDLNDITGGPALHKYRTILEPQNTPFRGSSRSVLPVRRLWLYLVRQEHLMDVFIRYIFTPKKPTSVDESNGVSPDVNILPEAFKVVQREHDPINAFVIHPNRFGLVAVSSGRELQEMDVSALFSPTIDWIQEQTDLDLAMAGMKKNPLIDNDDYLLITPQERRDGTLVTGRGTTYLTPFIVDRSRYALRKAIANESVARLERYFGESLPPVVLLPSLCKRHVPGVRRLEAHPTLPFYLSGANDGSVRLWEWGVGQPLYTPRVGGRFGKVTQTRFCAQGNKFGISDSDGFMCLWQIDNNLTLRKPFINMKCHSKICNDFVFLGQSSSLLATAGQGSVDGAVSLWDTLLPPSRYNVHTWNCHTDVTNCLLHVPNQQTLLCGGKHGDLHVWDVRQRQLRLTVKIFDSSGVRSLAMDPTFTFFAAGSTDGDIKVYNLNPNPQLVFHFPHEHSNRSTFSLRQVGSANQIHGVQMMYIDQQQRLYSCGADCSFKLRVLPPIF
ncbi:DmX-like protein 2 [Trichinella pseudospiralis]|uniref:DmX-like protein 2 n=1 Tax=Trichinella pseudospiralis TaxID=6337 RepID=A0A0V1E9A3_TRIPS|nr:DmX-like protein 2 [Trichinella pseudospiralis]